MCGRFLFIAEAELRDIVEAAKEQLQKKEIPYSVKTGEVFPTDIVPAVTVDGVQAMSWGYPKPWEDTGVVINTRTDSLSKAMWKASIESRRCVIPASGFYEWYHENGKTKKGAPKYLFTLPNEKILYMAGIYEPPNAADKCRLPHFSILTTEANHCMDIGFAGGQIRDRMPVVLRLQECEQWLLGDYRDLLRHSNISCLRELIVQ